MHTGGPGLARSLGWDRHAKRTAAQPHKARRKQGTVGVLQARSQGLQEYRVPVRCTHTRRKKGICIDRNALTKWDTSIQRDIIHYIL